MNNTAHSNEDNSSTISEVDSQDEILLKEIDEELKMERKSKRRANHFIAGLVLLIGALVGWVASLELLVGKFFLLENPGATLSCDINPFVSCGNVMMSWQSAAFGFPNMAIGLGGFAIMGVVGALMLCKDVKLPEWFSWASLGGMLFAFSFVNFLAYSAIFIIRSLCPWCMVIWAVVAPMFFVRLANIVEEKQWHEKYQGVSIFRHWIVLSVLWYVLVIVVIFVKFFHQWMAVLGLN